MTKPDENCIFFPNPIITKLSWKLCITHVFLYSLSSKFIYFLYLVKLYKALIWIDLIHSEALGILTSCQHKLCTIMYQFISFIFTRW